MSVDLSITKDDSTTTVVPGTVDIYTITVTNNGPDTVSSITLTDPIPPALLGASFSPSTGAYDLTSGEWSGLSLASGQSVTMTLTGTIDPSATGTLTNTVTVAPPAGVTDTNTADNTASDIDTLTPEVDLVISKTDGATSVVPGTSGNGYTITLTNNGPSTVSSVTLTDTIPPGLLNPVFGTPSVGSYDPGSGLWSGLSLASGQSVSITLSGMIDPNATGTLTNTVTVAPPAGVTDTNTADNTASDIDTLTPEADLVITKTDGATTVVPGTSDTYTIVVTNIGPSAVTGASVSDPLPAGVTGATWAFNGSSGGGIVSGPASGTGALATTVNLPVNATVTFTFTTEINPSATGSFANTATVTPPAGTTDPNPSNNSATDTDTLTPEADLAITKTDGVASVVPGGSTTYNIMVSNNGPSTAVDATVTDLFPAAFTAVNWTAVASAGSSVAVPSGFGNIVTPVTLLPGGFAIFTAVAQINPSATGSLTNTASVFPPAGGTDPDPGNNTATDIDTLTPQANPTLTTTASPNVTLSEPVVTLSDSATLSGGSNPTGTITFMLTDPASSTVDIETVTVNGNGTYTTPIGFTLPTTGTVAGTYFWTAQYSGDGNNIPANAPAEQTVVSAASPGLSTTASSGGLPGSTLTDIAHLSGGYFPTGTITFTLTDPGGSTVDIETVTVNGNGNYTTPTGFTGTVAGTYSWHVLYNGDGNNNAATANLENVTVGVPTAFAFPLPTFQLSAFGPSAGGWSSDNTYPRELADVDGVSGGSGRADIVGFSSAGVYVSLATGGGHFAAPTLELAAFGVDAGGWSSDNTYPRKLADVNGDTRADIIGFSSAGVFESLATAGGHFAAPTFELAAFGTDAGGWSSDDTYPRELADVNGDSMADIVGFGQSGVYVSLATAGGNFAMPTFELAAFGATAGGWSSDNTYPRELADVNGDGKADIVGFGADGVPVSLATGGGHFAMPTFELAAFGTNAGGWTSQDLYPRTLADVNGDSMADIVGFGADGVFVSLATGGGHFASPTFQLPAFGPMPAVGPATTPTRASWPTSVGMDWPTSSASLRTAYGLLRPCP